MNYDETKGRKENDRKRRAADSGEDEYTGGVPCGRQQTRTRNGNSEFTGDDQGTNYGKFHASQQTEKEENLVGAMRDRFEKQSTLINATRNQSKEGKIFGAFNTNEEERISSKGKSQLSSREPLHAMNFKCSKSPSKQHVSSGEIFNKSKSSFSGPGLADIEKSIKGAQNSRLVTKRKERDEGPFSDEAQEFYGQQEKDGASTEFGIVKKG
jgi:hypothetical protein